MSQFDVAKWNKQRYLAEANLLESKAQEAANAIDKVLDEVDPAGILPEDLGNAIAIIVKKGFQTEKQQVFMDALHKGLGIEESLNEEKSYDTHTVKITTADPKEGGPDEDFTEKVKVDSSLTGDDIKASIKDTVYDMGYRHLYKLNYEKA